MLGIQNERVKAWLREPLVHFLIAGSLVFGLNMLRGEQVVSADRTITLDEKQLASLVSQFEGVWHRAPTTAETQGLINEAVKDEIYYREALRLNLNADDPIVRRRMRSKMEFLAASSVENEEVSEANLQVWLNQNRAKYALGDRIEFDQLYFGQEQAAAQRALGLPDAAKGATPLSVPPHLVDVTAEDIARDFGDEFARSVMPLKPGGWQGPVKSGFGYHLVRIVKRVPGHVPPLTEVRQRVENDWRAEQRTTREAKAYQDLLKAYTIKIPPIK